jgi:hypothetical protein
MNMKKIKLILALLALMPFSRAFAQQDEIIYVDFKPDWCAQSSFDTLWIDFDENGSRDLIYYWQLASAATVRKIQTCDNSWEIHPMRDTDTIPTYQIIPKIENFWVTSMYCITPGYDTPGESKLWSVRHKVGNDYYYGWFKMQSSINISFDKYAFCTIPNYPLVWGQTDLLSVEEIEEKAFATIHPNPTTGIVRIEGEKAVEIQVFNPLGQLVQTVQNTNAINLEGLPHGVYLLRVTTEDGKVFSDKVVKE